MNRLEKYKAAMIKLCKTHKVKSLYAFGSVLTDSFDGESDIDLIVDFANMEVEDYADNYFDFKFSLQETSNGRLICWKRKRLRIHIFCKM
ncbi:nucleotidyltransferase family protein [Dyadobacter bucti]|uniref:nucleotidyltransferase family protein n=1 Tax=Dyadobacter bucti TaxID=2572203 RepID=UPI00197AC02E|nr:nucleotidyltransferase domain-containing protein [Dyadobacter bucti]